MNDNHSGDKNSFGSVLEDTKAQAGGIASKVQGAAQDLYGQARASASQTADAVFEGADLVRKTPFSFERAFRNMMETQPYTSALIALALGWLLGRSHRPL
jgi:uncharacterized protein YjbJ (UPF0337 family)